MLSSSISWYNIFGDAVCTVIAISAMMSNARGRGRNARRDSMGRYSRESYSYDDAKEDMMSELRELMQEAPDEETRKEFKRFMSKLSDM